MLANSERVAESEGMNKSMLEETTTTTTDTETTHKVPMVDIEDENEEDIDDEEALFVEIEKEKEKEEAEEAAHPHPHHHDIQSAPKLLQDALKTGAIKADLDSNDSQVHSTPIKEVKKEPVDGALTAEIDDEKKNEFGDVDAPPSDANQDHSPSVAEKVSVYRCTCIILMWGLHCYTELTALAKLHRASTAVHDLLSFHWRLSVVPFAPKL